MFFREAEILAVVVERTQVDVSGGVRGFNLKHLVIRGNCFRLHARIFFQRDAAGEPGCHFILARTGLVFSHRRAGQHLLALGKIHQELAGDRLQQAAFVTESDTMLCSR